MNCTVESIKNWNKAHTDYKIEIASEVPWLVDANYQRIQPLNPEWLIGHAEELIEARNNIQVQRKACKSFNVGDWVCVRENGKSYAWAGKLNHKNDFCIQVQTNYASYETFLFSKINWSISHAERLAHQRF